MGRSYCERCGGVAGLKHKCPKSLFDAAERVALAYLEGFVIPRPGRPGVGYGATETVRGDLENLTVAVKRERTRLNGIEKAQR